MVVVLLGPVGRATHGRLPPRYTIVQLGRFVCAVVMLLLRAGPREIAEIHGCQNRAVRIFAPL